jgi:hypothetical protein
MPSVLGDGDPDAGSAGPGAGARPVDPNGRPEFKTSKYDTRDINPYRHRLELIADRAGPRCGRHSGRSDTPSTPSSKSLPPPIPITIGRIQRSGEPGRPLGDAAGRARPLGAVEPPPPAAIRRTAGSLERPELIRGSGAFRVSVGLERLISGRPRTGDFRSSAASADPLLGPR